MGESKFNERDKKLAHRRGEEIATSAFGLLAMTEEKGIAGGQEIFAMTVGLIKMFRAYNLRPHIKNRKTT